MKQTLALITLILMVINLQSCRIFGYTQNPDEQLINMLNNREADVGTGPLLNGVYTLVLYENATHIIDSIHKAEGEGFIDPVFFYGNNIFTETWGLSVHSPRWDIHMFNDEKEYMLNRPWGAYQTENDVIKAISYVSFQGNSGNWDNRYLCYFEGKMEGRTKIVDWHIVPPYPELTSRELKYRYNQRILKELKASRTFEFRPFAAKTNIDSTKVWINKYRTDQK